MKEFYNYHKKLENDELCEDLLPTMPRHFDMIIMDLNMPIMDGYEACKQIIQIYKEFNNTKQIVWQNLN